MLDIESDLVAGVFVAEDIGVFGSAFQGDIEGPFPVFGIADGEASLLRQGIGECPAFVGIEIGLGLIKDVVRLFGSFGRFEGRLDFKVVSQGFQKRLDESVFGLGFIAAGSVSLQQSSDLVFQGLGFFLKRVPIRSARQRVVQKVIGKKLMVTMRRDDSGKRGFGHTGLLARGADSLRELYPMVRRFGRSRLGRIAWLNNGKKSVGS